MELNDGILALESSIATDGKFFYAIIKAGPIQSKEDAEAVMHGMSMVLAKDAAEGGALLASTYPEFTKH